MEQKSQSGPGASASSRVRFGDFELDLRAAELRKNGHRIRLQEQPFRILVELLKNPGEVLLREEIRKKLWPNDTTVEFDHSINAAVKRLRGSLQDSAESPRYIETLARRGYRFIAPVLREPEKTSQREVPPLASPAATTPVRNSGDVGGETVAAIPAGGTLSASITSPKISIGAPADQLVVSPLVEPASPDRVRRWLWLGAAGGLVVAAMAAWVLARRSPPHPPIPITRLTFDARVAWHPAISADGKYMAYASDRGESGDMHIWVQELPTGEPVRATEEEGNEDYPSFSADGSKIAFRSDRDGGGIYVVPLVGGEPRLLAPRGTRARYSPDGRLVLFFPGGTGEGGWESSHRVFLIPADGGERRPVSLPVQLGSAWVQTGSVWHEYSLPVFSPDARQLLYLAQAKAKFNEISTAWYVVPLDKGPSAPAGISEHWSSYGTIDEAPVPLAWLRGNRILYRASSGDAINLWLATLSARDWRLTKPPDQLTFGPGEITSASVSDSGTVVFGNTRAQTRLWSFALERGTGRAEKKFATLPSSGEIDWYPSLSDTGKLAYLSQKFGKWNVWLTDLSSGKQTWLANVEGNRGTISVVVNRAGSRVAYTTCRGERSMCTIFTVAATGGAPARVCDDCGMLRSWSSNGGVMVSQQPSPEGQNWTRFRINRIDTASGRTTILTEKPGTFLFAPDLSPDGRWIVFQARPAPVSDFEQLFVAPADESVPVAPSRWIALTDLQHFDADPQWSRDGKMVYFTSNRDGYTCLWALRLDSVTKRSAGQPFAVQHFHGTPRAHTLYPTFSVGLDRIVISLDQLQSDLWMMHLPEGH